MSTASSSSKPSGQWQPPTLEEMQAVLPQYQFVALLGRGGMGAVYKAVQITLDRAVAIKVLPGDLIDDMDANFAERFKNEARTMAKLNHPGIVNVYNCGETESGLLFIIMEFIDGTDVAKMIAEKSKLPPDYALAITAHVSDALAYAHKHGVIHRDIKPANILINQDGKVKVADFGLAKQSDAGLSGLTKTNMAMGTPDFVAPEALTPGMPVDHRADLYAMGVMLYQMLTGEIPRGMWTMPSKKHGTDPRYDQIIFKAMQTEPAQRYQDAMEIRRDLDVIMTVPMVKTEQPPSGAQPAAQKPVAQKPSAPQQRTASAPVRQMPAAPSGGVHQDTSADAPVPLKKSYDVVLYGIAAAAVVAALLIFMLGGGKKSAPKPAAAQVTQQTITPSPKPASTSSTPSPTTAPKPTPTSNVTAASPGEVRTFGGHRYQLVAEPLKWNDAKARAQAMDGHLVTITSQEEFDWVHKNFAPTLRTLPKPTAGGPQRFYTGGYQATDGGSWQWVTGEPFAMSLWPGKGPDDKDKNTAKHLLTWDVGSSSINPLIWDDVSVNFAARPFLVEWDDSGTPKPAPVAVAPALTGPVNLLATVDVKRDAMKGQWELKPDGLVLAQGTGQQFLGFTYAPPAEYDFEIEFTLTVGKEVAQILPLPGRAIMWKMGAYGIDPGSFGFGPTLDGKPMNNPTRTEAVVQLPRLKNNQRYRCVLEVRQKSLRAVLNGTEVVKWSGDFKRFQTEPAYNLPDPKCLGIGSYSSGVIFHTVEVRPPTGEPARVTEVKPANAAPAPAAAMPKPMPATVPTPTAAPPADPYLAKLEAGFQARYETDAQKPYLAAVATLNQSYVANGIARARAAAQAKGGVGEVTALDAEKAAIEKGSGVPEKDTEGTPESLKALRDTYRAALTKITAERDTKAAPLLDLYLKALDAYIIELTKADKIEEAKQVQALREAKAAAQPPSGVGESKNP